MKRKWIAISSVTPNLGGDAKIDQKTFLTEPVSSENLHNNRCTRNFWCRTQDGCVYSAAGSSAVEGHGRADKDAVFFRPRAVQHGGNVPVVPDVVRASPIEVYEQYPGIPAGSRADGREAIIPWNKGSDLGA